MHPALLRGAEQLHGMHGTCAPACRVRRAACGSGLCRSTRWELFSIDENVHGLRVSAAGTTGTRAKTEQTTNTRKPNTLLPGVLNRVWADRSRRLGAGDWAARRTGGRAPERRVKAAGRGPRQANQRTNASRSRGQSPVDSVVRSLQRASSRWCRCGTHVGWVRRVTGCWVRAAVARSRGQALRSRRVVIRSGRAVMVMSCSHRTLAITPPSVLHCPGVARRPSPAARRPVPWPPTLAVPSQSVPGCPWLVLPLDSCRPWSPGLMPWRADAVSRLALPCPCLVPPPPAPSPRPARPYAHGPHQTQRPTRNRNRHTKTLQLPSSGHPVQISIPLFSLKTLTLTPTSSPDCCSPHIHDHCSQVVCIATTLYHSPPGTLKHHPHSPRSPRLVDSNLINHPPLRPTSP